MNINCNNQGCPDIIDSSCVFYEGQNLIYTSINTNDSIELSLQKIDAKIQSILANSTLQGSGTANRIAKWASATNLTNSIITDDGVSITVGGNSTFNGTITANDIVSINKVAPTGTSLLRINGGANSAGNLFQFQNSKDAGLLKIGYFGNTGNRIEIDGGGDNNAPTIKFYEKIGSSAPTLNVWINSNTIGGWTYFNAGNVLIGKTVNGNYKLDVNGNIRISGIVEYASNAAALAAGLLAGAFYRTGEFLKVVY